MKVQAVLDLRNRRRIFELLSRYPGLHLRELERQLGLDVRALKHHLEFLEKHEAVVSMTQNGYLRHYPRMLYEGVFRERVGAFERKVLGLLRRRTFLQLVLILLDGGLLSVEDIQRQTGLAPSTLSHHLRKLEGLPIIISKREGRIKLYRVTDAPAMVQLLLKYRPTQDLIEDFLDLWAKIEL